ncbi:MAG: 3'-5' exoribonuclease [Jannaschia sp.]
MRYIIVDIETDGPRPGAHSMLSLAAVAMDQNGTAGASFACNLHTLPDTAPDPATEAWWRKRPGAWATARRDARAPKEAITQFVTFVRDFPAPRVLVAHPLLFDGPWIDHYLRRFAGIALMEGHGMADPLFFGAGIDLPSFVSGALDLPYPDCRHGRYPPGVASEHPHTHRAPDDARGHADVLSRTLRSIRTGKDPVPRP